MVSDGGSHRLTNGSAALNGSWAAHTLQLYQISVFINTENVSSLPRWHLNTQKEISLTL